MRALLCDLSYTLRDSMGGSPTLAKGWERDGAFWELQLGSRELEVQALGILSVQVQAGVHNERGSVQEGDHIVQGTSRDVDDLHMKPFLELRHHGCICMGLHKTSKPPGSGDLRMGKAQRDTCHSMQVHCMLVELSFVTW